MKRLRKFCGLPSPYRYLLVRVTVLLGGVRLGLWLVPFPTLRRLLARLIRAHAGAGDGDAAAIPQVVWAVTVASRYVPAATCLTQALAAQALLSQRGHEARLCLGVARGTAGEFQAHAWVECQGRVVLGGIDARARFTPLLSLDRDGA